MPTIPPTHFALTNHPEEICHTVITMMGSRFQNRVSIMPRRLYIAIVFDNNARKTICRLYLDKTTKSIGIMNIHNVETRRKFASLKELIAYAPELQSRAKSFI